MIVSTCSYFSYYQVFVVWHVLQVNTTIGTLANIYRFHFSYIIWTCFRPLHLFCIAKLIPGNNNRPEPRLTSFQRNLCYKLLVGGTDPGKNIRVFNRYVPVPA